MAKPIKETPILKGRDAANFLEAVNANPQRKVSAETSARIKRNFESLKAIAAS
ncbi:hypothetical protein [Spirosoma sp. KNUC1025]|uniref:hypothetical protein n=1 Tax=Spirosoma sp. KNUC1025 TaxID=2894082 RepID=UPI0038651EE2|nr:hypothetical protein LN737_01275 [Spirosoma sp. KNUC1025]